MPVDMSDAAYERVMERVTSNEPTAQRYAEQQRERGLEPEPVKVEIEEEGSETQYKQESRSAQRYDGHSVSQSYEAWHKDVMSQYS